MQATQKLVATPCLTELHKREHHQVEQQRQQEQEQHSQQDQQGRHRDTSQKTGAAQDSKTMGQKPPM